MQYWCKEYIHGYGHGYIYSNDYKNGHDYTYGRSYYHGYNYGEGFGVSPSTLVTGVKLEEVVLNAVLV